jgi:hypothetical protein
VNQQTNRVYTGVLGPLGVVPYTHGNARGIGVVGVIDGGKGAKHSNRATINQVVYLRGLAQYAPQ